ncbi:hypothetical protein CNR22_03035 [Sphingobacteriaceae bacterium]|nr:hypothetical protein CNR22_03035 [Sphingobacteriaceae bacterium]
MNAKETLQFRATTESSNSSFIFKNRTQPRNILKLKTSAFSSSSARDWEEAEVTGGGLFLNFGLHFPSKKFLNPYYESGDATYKIGFDFEFGNYFRFAKLADDKVGIGLRATWLSLSYTAMSIDGDRFRAAQISPLRVGPQVGVAINETMGVDLFYQIGFNLTDEFGALESNDPTTTEKIGFNSIYTGVSHEVGAAYHFKVFSVGLGYRFGRLTNISRIYDGTDIDEDTDEKYSVGNFRATLGFKF